MKSLPKRVQSPISTVWEIGRSLGQFLGDRPVSSAILALGAAALALWFIPMWQAAIVGLQGQAGLELENQLRQTLAQILAGAFVLAGLYLGWRRVVVAQEGQFTERFTRAVDQVGSEKLEIRLGGIYALERLAKDSADKDHWTIMEVLTAFVREQSSRTQVSGQLSNDLKVSSHKKNSRPLEQDRATDIQAAITVLGRRTRYFQYGEDKRLDLFQANLRKMDLSQGHWEGANFARAHLEGAILTEAHLEGAILTEARLEGAILGGVHLEGASLNGAHLEGAYLIEAHLEGATLSEAYLEGAGLHRAHLEGATLRGARLEGATLNEAHLERAILIEAHLERVGLRGAHLEGAILNEAHLEGAGLGGAHLDRAGLQRAHLSNTDLSGVNLRNVTGLTQEQIGSAVCDEATVFPVYTSSSKKAKRGSPTRTVSNKKEAPHNKDQKDIEEGKNKSTST